VSIRIVHNDIRCMASVEIFPLLPCVYVEVQIVEGWPDSSPGPAVCLSRSELVCSHSLPANLCHRQLLQASKVSRTVAINPAKIPSMRCGFIISNFLLNGVAGTMIVSLQLVQLGGNMTAQQAGMLTLGYAVAIIAFIRVGEKLLQRFGARKPMIWGCLITGLSILLLLPANVMLSEYKNFRGHWLHFLYGAEWAFWGNWSARIEYDYVGLTSQTLLFRRQSEAFPPATNSAATTETFRW
jgi:hypothetical protein